MKGMRKRWPFGTSLVEIVVVMGVMSIVFGVVGTWSIRMVHTYQEGNRNLIERMALERLSTSILSDGRNAQEWIGGRRIFILGANQEIRYQENEGWVERQVVSNGKLSHREHFRIPTHYQIEWPNSATSGQACTWSLARRPSPLTNGKTNPANQQERSRGAEIWNVTVSLGRIHPSVKQIHRTELAISTDRQGEP